MKRRLAQLGVLASALSFCVSAVAENDLFLQLSSPILTNGQVQFTLTGESGVSYVIESSSDAQSWSPVMTNSSSGITRSITLPLSNGSSFFRARRFRLPMFPGAVIAKRLIDFKGNNTHFDSYDSADPVKSTGGMYDPTKAQARGDVSGQEGLVNVSNVFVNGKLKIGSNGSYALGSNGYVGPIGWNGPGLFSPEWAQADFRFVSPPISPPYSSGFPIPPGVGTNFTVLGGANYFVDGDVRPTGSSKAILVVGIATLYVTGDFALPATWPIKIEPGAALRLYVGTAQGPAVSIQIGRVSIANGASVATFQLYGLPTCNSVTWIDNDVYNGTIYAPQAMITVGSGGNNINDYQGAIVAESVRLDGHFNLHYDESLEKKGPQH